MAISTAAQFVVHQEEFQTGQTETLEQYANDMTVGLAGTVRMISRNMIGDYEKEAFFKVTSNLVSERNPASVLASVPTGLLQDEVIGIKVHRKIHNENTLDAFRKIGSDQSLMSFVLGQQSGKAVALDYLNTGLTALTAAIGTESGMVLNITTETTKTISMSALNRARAKLGDAGQSIRAWVMPSTAYYDLVGTQIADKVTGVHDVVVYGGLPATLGLPVYVTDSPALINLDPAGDNSKPAEYTVLGLTEDALVLTDSEESAVISELVGGLENIVARYQAEYAYSVKVKGFEYKGTKSPSAATLGSGANWDYVMTSIKSGPGVKLVVNAL